MSKQATGFGVIVDINSDGSFAKGSASTVRGGRENAEKVRDFHLGTGRTAVVATWREVPTATGFRRRWFPGA